MSKNVIHNFNLSIKNSADIKSSEHLTETIIKELAKVSKEMSQQKDIVQLWQEQNNQTATAILNNSTASIEGDAIDTSAGTMQNPMQLISNTLSVLEGMQDSMVSTGTLESGLFTTLTTTPIEGGAADNTLRTEMSSSASTGITPSVMGDQNLTNQAYSGISVQQSLMVPESFQINDNEPSVEVIKAEVKKKLDAAVIENDTESIKYWTSISKAFDQGATVLDFDGKPGNELFTQMYVELKQLNFSAVVAQSFNWEIVREKMIKAIDANILKGSISNDSKKRWEIIKDQLANDKTNIANLFERYDELFLLLKEVQGLDNLPTTITIITKTKIYPNLSADKLYPEIGKEAIYGRLKQIIETNFKGSGVNKGALKIRNTKQTSFIIGESLEFFVDEAFINQMHNQKENINWIVYNSDTKKENIFKNEGTSFSYNFDTHGTYRIDAYGENYTVKQKKSAKTATFIELKIITQEIVIAPPANVAGGFVRPFSEEKNFKVSLKHTAVKTLNPLKLYYQIETATTGKTTIISEERELDSAGSIKLSMPDLGTYKIKVFSKNQYALVKEFKTSVIKNEVTRIGLADKASNNNVFLLGIHDGTVTLEAKKFKINPPTDAEKEDVSWMIYDSTNKRYLAPGTELFTNKKDPQTAYIHKWNSFIMPIPQKPGHYTVEAFSDRQKGAKSECVYKMEVKHPEVTEAYWSWSGGSKKEISGFSGESNYIKAQIPHYENQKVRVYFYLNKAKTNHYIDVKTNAKGEIFEEVKFDAGFQKAIGFTNGKNAKIGFKLLGIQNSKPYPFKTPANYELDTVLSVTTDAKILDVYFTYDGVRVRPEDEVPFGKNGAIVTIVAKTQNLVGQEINLTAHKVREKPSFSNKARVNSEGVATISFTLMNLNKKLKNGSQIKYYAGVEGYSTKHLTDKLLTMVVGDGNVNKGEIIDEDDPQLIWGAKVNKDFRVKVVQICKELWPKNTLEMANGLMAVMYRETGGNFAPNQIEGKSLISKEQINKKTFEKYINGKKYSRAVGLIQFTQNALTSMGEYTGGGHDVLNELKVQYANMTQLEQLAKVKIYMEKVKTLPVIHEDIYVAVFAPYHVGKGLDKTMYELGTVDYSQNANLDIDKEKNGIQMRELITEYYTSLNDGEYGRNIWRNPLDKMELRGWYSTWRPEDSNDGIVPTRIAGKHDGLDLYASVGTPVFACVDGIRVRVGPNPSSTYGNTITIKGFYNGKEYYFFYAHLSETFIKIGEKVKAGKKIGLTGKTGNARDLLAKKTHLHFEVRNSSASQGASVKPFKAISELKESVNINPNKENQK
ncbi:M23 family metallopeptidase [Flavobacterium sp. CSZ]|uniref:M23 family metallopeptidase n=1 Tax=Flavobacterium sp. CSZ TaxID=2783791 RepID=UPI00188A6147|nr:M23 family metallopeptidase [Flavobacterium sp. CSZ]MBF4484376.1 M23 family metallopeptidase [Flavobacterium sp. CSZ]